MLVARQFQPSGLLSTSCHCGKGITGGNTRGKRPLAGSRTTCQNQHNISKCEYQQRYSQLFQRLMTRKAPSARDCQDHLFCWWNSRNNPKNRMLIIKISPIQFLYASIQKLPDLSTRLKKCHKGNPYPINHKSYQNRNDREHCFAKLVGNITTKALIIAMSRTILSKPEQPTSTAPEGRTTLTPWRETSNQWDRIKLRT